MAKKVLRRNRAGAAVPVPSSGPLCVVYSTYSPVEAHLVKSLLEDSGIACYLSNEFITIVDNPVSTVTGGVKVQVRESDMLQARAVLREQSQP